MNQKSKPKYKPLTMEDFADVSEEKMKSLIDGARFALGMDVDEESKKEEEIVEPKRKKK